MSRPAIGGGGADAHDQKESNETIFQHPPKILFPPTPIAQRTPTDRAAPAPYSPGPPSAPTPQSSIRLHPPPPAGNVRPEKRPRNIPRPSPAPASLVCAA